MALRYCEPINFEETCSISGVDALAVGLCQHNGHTIILVTQELIAMAVQFVEYKFGMVPEGDGAFIWDKGEGTVRYGTQVADDDVQDDSARFFRLMSFYEHKLCS